MKRNHLWIAVLMLVGSVGRTAPAARTVNWPAFRGENATGIGEGFETPTTWNIEKKDHVRWSAAVPGIGHSSPVIWGNNIFLTTAISKKGNDLKVGLYGDIASVEDESMHTYKVLCLDKRTGKVVWERTAFEGVPAVKRHTKATHANCTPATDGKRVVTFFGSEGLYCYDMAGKPLWKRDFGLLDSGYYVVPTAQWEFAASPVIRNDRIYIQCDVQKDSFIACLDAKNGQFIWKTPRADVPTWSTPALYDDGKRLQFIVNGYKHIGGYDARTGKELWKLTGGGDIPVPTPIVANGLIYIQNAHGRMAPIYAIKAAAATGDITPKDDQASNDGIAWWTRRDGGYMQTPLVIGQYYYTCQTNGVLSCFEAANGKKLYSERLGSGRTAFTSSPIAVGNKIYVSSEDGDVYVVQTGPQFKILATNPLGEPCLATPAISDGTLYWRTQGHLIAIGGSNG